MAATKNRVSREKFIEVNVQAHKEQKGIAWIAQTLGLTEAYVAQRRTSLRTQGVPLPELNRGGSANRMDVNAAREFLAKLTGQDVATVATEGDKLVAEAAKRAAERAAESTPAQ